MKLGLPGIILTFFWLVFLTNLGYPQKRTVNYVESTVIIPNPERGWYFPLMPTDKNTNPFYTAEMLGKIKCDSMRTRIVLHKILISNNGPIPASLLDSLQNEADLIRGAGFKIIYRFTYNWIQSKGKDDASKEQIFAHLDQMKDFFSKNGDIILFIEPGFIGSWGEWHHSTNNLLEATNSTRLNDASREILNKVLEVLPADRMTGLRYPHLKWASTAPGSPNGGLGYPIPLDETNAYNGSKASRIGYYNQRFVRSAGDMWSLIKTPSPERNYPLYMHKDTEFVPSWGEPEESTYAQSPESGKRALSEARMFHYVSLNGYRSSCPKVYKVWKDSSAFSGLTNKLGYRFRLIEMTFPEKAIAGEMYSMQLSIANDGFARPVNPRIVEFVFRNTKNLSEYKMQYKPTCDERIWLPGAESEKILLIEIKIPGTIPNGNYQILLNLPDPMPSLKSNPDYSIQLANKGTWESKTGYNNLFYIIKINKK